MHRVDDVGLCGIGRLIHFQVEKDGFTYEEINRS